MIGPQTMTGFLAMYGTLPCIGFLEDLARGSIPGFLFEAARFIRMDCFPLTTSQLRDGILCLYGKLLKMARINVMGFLTKSARMFSWLSCCLGTRWYDHMTRDFSFGFLENDGTLLKRG